MGALKITTLALTGIAVLAVLYIGFRAWAVWEAGYTWKEMDWNSDGRTSIAEVFESSDIGCRLVKDNGMQCTEYYSFKDGLRVKLSCKA